MADVGTVREIVERLNSEGIKLSEYGLRILIKSGVIPAAKVGKRKILVNYQNVIRYLQQEAD